MIQIITYSERYKADFIRLNRQWIETYFRLEESDLNTFAHIDTNRRRRVSRRNPADCCDVRHVASYCKAVK